MAAKKRKKQETIGKIHRRLFKKWSLIVRGSADHSCEYCGIKKGDINKNGNNKNGKPTKIDAHHLVSRNIKDTPLKFDKRNGIAVDPICHKFGEGSFHKAPVPTMEWFRHNRAEDHQFILENFHVKVDLDNRKVLAEIERCLDNDELLDYDRLKAIEAEFPRPSRKIKIEIEGTLFDEDEDEDADEVEDEDIKACLD